MIEHELCICEYVDGKLHHWLALQENPVRIKQMDEVIWEGEAHELCALIEHLRTENARLKREDGVMAAQLRTMGVKRIIEGP